jgi:5-methylcytosine-specific restriction protein A
MRELVLREEPVCRICSRNASTIADHVIPLRTARDARELAQLKRRSNYQGLCQPCHDRKRGTEDKRWAHSPAPRARARLAT